jgi:hypothetical protein
MFKNLFLLLSPCLSLIPVIVRVNEELLERKVAAPV